MNQVTQEQFYAFVGPLDVIVDVYSSDDSLFKMRYGGKIMGKIVDSPVRWEAACSVNRSYFIAQKPY
jgi:hypothetical protein